MYTKKYALVIDEKRCIGCHTCAIACKVENNMPNDIAVNVVLTEGSSINDIPNNGTALTETCTMNDFNKLGALKLNYYTRSCQHCADAPCVKICPTQCTKQTPEGVVDMDVKKCVGCFSCMTVCPYEYNTMRVKVANPKFNMPFEVGGQKAEKIVNNTVVKCTFCAHRLKDGLVPACIVSCPGKARFFGDLNDTGSQVYKLVHCGRAVKHVSPVIGKTANQSSVYIIAPE